MAKHAAGRRIQTGDYTMPKDEVQHDGSGEKMLVNIGEHRKRWIKRVAGGLSDGDMTEVLKCVIDQAAAEDPESYAVKVEKWRLKSQLDELEREEKALLEKKQQLINHLEGQLQAKVQEGATAQ